MSDRPPRTGLGLSDHILDPEILTKEIDHDFFDEPPEATTSIDFKDCQQQLMASSKMPNQNRKGYEASASSMSPGAQNGARLDKSFRKLRRENLDELNNESGRSSSNLTVHMEMDRGLNNGENGEATNDPSRIAGACAEAEAEFYSIHQSNATSPNYPRPKQCYQLQQQRRSIGSIKRGTNLNGTNETQSCHAVNVGDCDLDGMFADDEMLSTSSEEEGSRSSDSDSDLSDSTESELDSLESDDEELVDMLGKYFEYIKEESDCSDLTEVSPLSSLSASPLPPLFVQEEGDDEEFGAVLRMADMTLVTDGSCSPTGFHIEPENEGLSSRAADIVYDRSPAEQMELKSSDYGKPKLPLFISTTECIIVPEDGINGKDDEEDEDPATVLEELLEKDMQKVDQQVAGMTDNKIGLDLKEAEIKQVSSVQANGSGISTEAHSKDCSNDNSTASFNFSASSLPAKEENFSRSSSATAGWSLSSAGVGNEGNGRSTSSTSATSSSGSSSRGSGNGNGGKRAVKNFTFTPDQMRRIERENHILLRKILDANSKGQHFQPHAHLRHRSGHHGHLARHHHKPFSASTARLRQQKRIEHENNILMKRLQSVKPSKEIVEAFEKPVGKN